jgi:hypothetical protein
MDCFSGISGNMTIGAFLDLGVDEKMLVNELKKLNVDGYKIEISKKVKNGIEGTYFDVILEDEEHEHEHSHEHEHIHEHAHHDHDHAHHEHHKHEHSHEHEHSHDHVHHDHDHAHHDHEHHNHDHSHDHDHHNENSHNHVDQQKHLHRNLFDIEKIIDDSELSQNVKDLSKKIFNYVAVAEAKVHGKAISEVHFHEVGAIDSIVDIIGTAICVDSLNIDKIIVSKLHVGMGFVKCQHGLMPIPAPATLEIIKNGKIPVYSKGIEGELVTPTGAAIVAALADEFGNQPDMEIEKIGYGSGFKDFEIPNMLRLTLGKKKLI